MFSYNLLRLLSLLTLTLHTTVADDPTFFNTASDSFPISGLDGNLKASNTKIPNLGSNEPLRKVSDLQFDEPLFLVDQNSRCSGNSPEEVQSSARKQGRWRRNRGESRSCANPQYNEQRGTYSPPQSTDEGQQAGTAVTKPGSSQRTKRISPSLWLPPGRS